MNWLLLSIAIAAADDGASPHALLEAGHFKQVRALAEARLAANAGDATALYLLGRVKLAYGDLDAALALGEKAVAADARSADCHYLLAAAAGQKAQRAGLLSRLGLARRFKREAETAVALDSRHVEARAGLIEFHLQAPGVVGGDKAAARTLADAIAAIDPARGYLMQARIAQAEKQTQLLEGFYLQAVRADPRRYVARMALGGYYAGDSRKDYPRAEEQARAALELDPGRAGAYALLAAVFVKQGRMDELEAVLAEADRRVPDNPGPQFQAGRMLQVEGKQLARAERCFRKYLAQEPEGNAPSHAQAYFRLGEVLAAQGRNAEARSAYEAALKLRPDFDEAKQSLRRLR